MPLPGILVHDPFLIAQLGELVSVLGPHALVLQYGEGRRVPALIFLPY
jgi:hypothetical protein